MKKINIYLSALALLISVNFIQAQDKKSDLELPFFGIGLHVEQFKAKDLMFTYSSNLYMTTFTIPINLTDHFRVEPEAGFTINSDLFKRDDPDQDDYEYKSSGYCAGLGAYYMFQRGKLNFYTGAKFKLTSATIEGGYGSISGITPVEKNISYGIGPVLGFEYFFGNHFSFGGEVGLNYYRSDSKIEYPEDPFNPGFPFDEDEEFQTTNMQFNSGLFIRAYF